MGWRSIAKDGEIRYEGHPDPFLGGRPVDAGEEGKLLIIEQNDYGHRVAVDLTNGIILIDYEEDITIQNTTIEAKNPKLVLFLADDTNLLSDMKHLRQEFVWARDVNGRKIRDENKEIVKVRNDILTPMLYRPIWFSRHISTLPAPVKVIGVQTTLPELQGGGNYKRMVMIYPDGRLAIS
jgi:hypothetical protein